LQTRPRPDNLSLDLSPHLDIVFEFDNLRGEFRVPFSRARWCTPADFCTSPDAIARFEGKHYNMNLCACYQCIGAVIAKTAALPSASSQYLPPVHASSSSHYAATCPTGSIVSTQTL
jgi:hypothetical protein